MAFPVKFVHIGLGKCASTYLQEVWGADPGYVTGNPAVLVETARERAARSCFDAVNIPLPGFRGDKTAIISSEGLSWGWINGTGGQQLLRNLRKIVADSLLASRVTGQVLIVVRDPIGWLRALHEQAVKEGGYHPYKTYIGYKKELALEVMDLAYLVGLYREAGCNVVVLSADELRRSPDVFWGKYADSLDVPKPSAATIAAVNKAELSGNVSLNERVPYLAKLNRHSSLLGKCFADLSRYPALFKTERDTLKLVVSEHLVRINRRVAEFAEFSELKAVAGEVEDASEFQDVFVDPEMASRIEKNFVSCLAKEETIDPAWIDECRRSLDEGLRCH